MTAAASSTRSLRDTSTPATVAFGEPTRQVAIPRWAVLSAAIVAQAIVARLLYQQPILALAQAGGVLALAGWAVVKRNGELSLLLVAYVTSAEIAWRQARGPIPFQYGPYIVTFIAVLAVITLYPTLSKVARRALLYLALLLPSSVITISAATGTARQALAFALSGPVALAFLVVWLSHVRVQPWFYRRLLWTILISGVGPLTIAVTNITDYIGTGGQIEFDNEANFVTSGGFGPVQVSSVLGLTVLVAVLLILVERELIARALAAVVGLAAAVQSFLTFSRGGMFATAFAVAALAVTQASNRETRRRVIAVVAVIFAVGYFIVIPRIDRFTQGKFEERFSDTKSGRTELAHNDVAIFGRHPLFGVGPGMTKYQRLSYDICELRNDHCDAEPSSHTEFTRMLSEHGIPGLVAIGVLASLAVAAVTRAGRSRAFAVTFLTWAVAQMFYANIRVVAVAIAFGFAFIRVGPPEEEPPDSPTGSVSPAPSLV